MQLKKAIAAGAIGAIMVGSTVAFAADLSNFPSPFVTKDPGASNYLVVVGSTALPSDVAGAIDIAARLGGEATTKTSTPVTGGGVGVSVTNGVSLDTTNTKLKMGDNLASAKQTLTATNLPSVLAQGSVFDLSGNEYKFDQYIRLGSTPVYAYARPTSNSDPAPVIDGGVTQTSATPFYTSRIVFQKPLVGSITSGTSTSLDGKSIKLFGQDYSLGSGITTELSNTTLVMYGGGSDVGIDWGMGTSPSQTVTVSGVTVAITLNGIKSNGNAADFTIDGTSYDSQAAGTYITSASGVRIYVKSISLYGTGGAGRVVFKVGANKIKLQNGQSVKTGNNEDPVRGTQVTISAAGTNNAISIGSIAIDVFPYDADHRYISTGTDFMDPVFGTFKLQFKDVSPSMSDTTRDTTTVQYSGDNYAQVSFTDRNGVSKTLTFASNVVSGTPSATILNLTDGTYLYHVNENETIAANEYTFVSQSGFSHLLQYTTNSLTDTSPSVTLRDVVSSTDYKVYLTNGWGSAVIDGYSYNVTNVTTSNIKVLRQYSATTSADGTIGRPYALYTPLILKNGAALSITEPLIVGNMSYYTVPGNNTALDEGFYTFQLNCSNVAVATFLAGNVNYSYNTTGGASNTCLIYPTGLNAMGSNQSAGIILLEEKDAASQRNAIEVPISISGSSPYRVQVGTPVSTYAGIGNAFLSSTTNAYVQKGLDLYGVLASRDTSAGSNQGVVTMSYPNDQVVALLFVGGNDMVVSLAGGAGGICESTTPVKVITPVARLDTEITSTDKNNYNIIAVGGPCVNSLVATLATANKFPYSCDNWPGRNFGVIQLVNDAFASGKSALVVAGTTAADTKRATTAVMTGTGLSGTSKEV